jgi:hypothetical protein
MSFGCDPAACRAAKLARGFGGCSAQHANDVECLLGRRAHAAVQLHDRLEQLVLHEAAIDLDSGDHLARRGSLRERVRVHEHQLLLDAEREDAAPVGLLHAALIPCTGLPAASHA